MDKQLTEDLAQFDLILKKVVIETNRFLSGLDAMPAGAVLPESIQSVGLCDEGLGALQTLDFFQEHYSHWLSGSTGPRFYGLVTGGVTPAALAGDWLVSVYDQNNVGSDESIAPQIEVDTIALLRQLFGLPDDFLGTFVSGATMSNFVSLALGRQWIGNQKGLNIAENGLWGLDPIRILSGSPHSSVYKALSMLGMGRDALILVPCLADREAINVTELEGYLKLQKDQPCIVVANAGTVNTVDFDDLQAIAKLREKYNFWLHVDAAFGGFAACSPKYRDLVRGMDLADSITVDAHKWLNVPYDSAMQFTRHPVLQPLVFQNSAVYLEQSYSNHNFINLTPENSRRLRALPSWFSLMAYGKQGYAEIVERNCQLAHWMGTQIENSDVFELLAPVKLNGVCFTFGKGKFDLSTKIVKKYLDRLQNKGDVYLTPTIYQEIPAIRISITNWRTTQKDVELAWKSMLHEASEFISSL